jgi:prophage DNA circulation protein
VGGEEMFGIKEARAELLNYVSNLSDKEAAFLAENKEWSILDILEHLYVIEKLMSSEIKQILEKGERKRAFKHKPLDSTLDRSTKYMAPENMKPSKQFTSILIAKDKLASSRQELLEILEAYDPSELKANSGKHPAFGTISVEQWVEFIGLHERRHLAQIKDMITRL